MCGLQPFRLDVLQLWEPRSHPVTYSKLHGFVCNSLYSKRETREEFSTFLIFQTQPWRNQLNEACVEGKFMKLWIKIKSQGKVSRQGHSKQLSEALWGSAGVEDTEGLCPPSPHVGQTTPCSSVRLPSTFACVFISADLRGKDQTFLGRLFDMTQSSPRTFSWADSRYLRGETKGSGFWCWLSHYRKVSQNVTEGFNTCILSFL